MLTGGIVLVLLGLLGGGQRGTVNPLMIGLGRGAASWLFVVIERRVPEPILPLDLFRNPFIAVPCLAGLVTGTIQFGIPSYVPLFVQGVQFGTAGDAAKALGAVSVAWTLAAFASPRLLIRVGFRAVAVGGMMLIACGVSALLLYRQGTPIGLMMVESLPDRPRPGFHLERLPAGGAECGRLGAARRGDRLGPVHAHDRRDARHRRARCGAERPAGPDAPRRRDRRRECPARSERAR